MKRNKTTIITAIATLIVGFGMGWYVFEDFTKQAESHDHENTNSNETYTCSMHPQIRQNEPGQCPLCGMDLIPVAMDDSNDDPLSVKMSPTAMQLASVQTATVRKKQAIKSLRLNGKVQADERAISSQVSHIGGRIERLFVNATGESVRRGQVIAYVYSPDLVTAQAELFEASKIKAEQPSLYKAARNKLKNWKLTDRQIDNILNKGEAIESFPIVAGTTGIVSKKYVNVGDYLKPGQALFEISDFKNLWVLFDIYESDLAWVKVGNNITYSVASIPGKTFAGKISFIDPAINAKTRVAQARVVFDNAGSLLKPEMFVIGKTESPISNEKIISIPKTAVLWTGERSIVYLKTNSSEGISFILREVTLGPALGNSYIIKEGLTEGEEIVVNGTFSIDAAAQLAGKPSMMNPAGGTTRTGHEHHALPISVVETSIDNKTKTLTISNSAKETLMNLFSLYISFKDALVEDDFDKAQNTALQFQKDLNSVDMSEFKGAAHMQWMTQSENLKKSLNRMLNNKNIDDLRGSFIALSENVILLSKTFDFANDTIYILNCPMANNNKGADWLSIEKKVLNPYFGSNMLTCGSVKEKIYK